MLKVLKNLKKLFLEVCIIVILLCIQAATDLALPDYTSKIVNNGIQYGGIEIGVPEVISKEDMELISMFSDKADDIVKNYTLLGDNIDKQEEKVVNKYFGKDYKVEPNTIYVLNEMEDEEKQELAKILTTPLMEVTTIKDEETANQIKEQMAANMPEEQQAYIQNMTLVEIIQNIPEEQRNQVLSQFTEKINNFCKRNLSGFRS